MVIVGYGMAGARLAEEIRQRDPDGSRVAVTVLGAERHPAYNRVLLSHVMAGTMAPRDVLLHRPDWADRHHVALRRGVLVTRIDREARQVVLDDGQAAPYDRLVLATGSNPWLPPTEGLRADDGELADGVSVFRGLDDCERILGSARPGARVAVLGGGLLGLETARALVQRGHGVTVVHPGGHLLDRQLDRPAGRVLQRILGEFGIRFRLGQPASRFVPGDGLKLADGTPVSAELVVVAAGVRPDTTLATRAGIAADRGVLVDDELRTSDPLVHAIGDCAQHAAATAGLVQPGWEQARVLADLVTGTGPQARYAGTATVTSLKARGVDLLALGEVHVEPHDTTAEVLRLEDPARGRYAKLVLRGEKVAGAIMIGLPDAAATVSFLYDKRIPVPTDRLALLLGRALPGVDAAAAGGNAADLPDSAQVCRCNTVSKGTLARAWQAGATTLSALADQTRATTGCGSCREAVCALMAALSVRLPAGVPT